MVSLLIFHNLSAQTLQPGTPVVNGYVSDFEKVGNTVYFGGNFSQVNGVAHSGLGSFDAVTGTVGNFNPVIPVGDVSTVTRVGNKLIVCGDFTEINGQQRWGIAMFDLTTGNLEPFQDTANMYSWRMGVGVYNNLFFYNTRLNPSGQTRLVCVDATTGNFTSWQSDSTFYGDINAVYADGNYVYAGGAFNVGAGNQVYNNLCRFDQATGALDTTWHPEIVLNSFGITEIVKADGQIIVGGDFDTISGVQRKGVAGFNPDGTLSSFNQYSSSYQVFALCADGPYVWVGGNSSTLGGALRWRIAQIRVSNSQATCWNASPTSSSWSATWSIMVTGDTVYAAPVGSPYLSVFTGSPLPQPAATLSGPAVLTPFQTANYSVQSVPGNTYTWLIAGGSGSSTTNSINVTWGAGPAGSVSVIVNNPALMNCYSDTVSLPVSITTSVQDIEDARNLNVSPNPFNTGFILETNNIPEGSKMKIADMTGRLIFDGKINSLSFEMDASRWLSGVYLLHVETPTGTLIRKIVKQ